MAQWEFVDRPGEGWRWRHVGAGATVIKTAERCFPTLGECVTDAIRHGYSGKPLMDGAVPCESDVPRSLRHWE